MMMQRDYDSTVARIAGNILSGMAEKMFGGSAEDEAWWIASNTKSRRRGESFSVVVAVVGAIVYVVVGISLAYVAVHFIAKYW